MDYRGVLRCSAQCVRYRWLPLHEGVDSAPKTLSDDLCRHASSRSLPHGRRVHAADGVTRKGPRMALDAEVEPFVTEKGESTFTLTEAAMKTGDLKLEWQRARYNNAKLYEF